MALRVVHHQLRVGMTTGDIGLGGGGEEQVTIL